MSEGTCRVIHAVYKPACNFKGCDDGDGPGITRLRATMAEACVVGRQVARTICRGADKTPSGETHEKEIEKAVDKLKKCLDKMKSCPVR